MWSRLTSSWLETLDCRSSASSGFGVGSGCSAWRVEARVVREVEPDITRFGDGWQEDDQSWRSRRD